jgi:hypothetical protein
LYGRDATIDPVSDPASPLLPLPLEHPPVVTPASSATKSPLDPFTMSPYPLVEWPTTARQAP